MRRVSYEGEIRRDVEDGKKEEMAKGEIRMSR